MADSYTELKGLPELKGSINLVVSEAYRLRRPPSLSESHAWTPENVERAMSMSSVERQMTIPLLSEVAPQLIVEQTEQTEQIEQIEQIEQKTCCASLHILLISFLFHIFLISIFESVFFFFYVSVMENDGILKTVDGFVGKLVGSCEFMTPLEIQIADDLLTPYVNVSVIQANGNSAYQDRDRVNTRLVRLTWYYVAGLAALFMLAATTGWLRALRIPWRRLILENCGLVTLLGIYEAMFFTTIVYPYLPISGPEIAANTLLQIQDTCHILTDI